MMTYILVAIAAIFNNFMDALQWWKKDTIFRDLDDKWWNPNVSYLYVKNFLGWMRFDAWHIAKTISVLCLLTSAVCAHFFGIPLGWWAIPVLYAEWGIVWEATRRLIKKK